jgi:rare lipoprotein A
MPDAMISIEKRIPPPPPDEEKCPKTITGIASWYDYRLDGIVWSKNHLTAASRRFERYSYVKVTNQDNGKSVVVYINDFGPEEWTEREIDLSSHAFSQLAPLSAGLIKVKVEQYDANRE